MIATVNNINVLILRYSYRKKDTSSSYCLIKISELPLASAKDASVMIG